MKWYRQIAYLLRGSSWREFVQFEHTYVQMTYSYILIIICEQQKANIFINVFDQYEHTSYWRKPGKRFKVKTHWLIMVLKYCLMQSLLWKQMAVNPRLQSGECSKQEYLVFMNVSLKLSGHIWHFQDAKLKYLTYHGDPFICA